MDLLIKKIIEKQNPTVVGLDPQWDFIPDDIKRKHLLGKQDTITEVCGAILEFNERIISAISFVVPAVKPNCAFYEQFGWQGMRVLYETIDFAKSKNLYVISDGKRNDIGSTMKSYAQAYIGITQVEDINFRAFPSDALTVNAYLGSDGIEPATDLCAKYDKDIFVLVKTSNASSGELQDMNLKFSPIPIYEKVALMCKNWGENLIGQYGYSSVGIVVGATYPDQLKELRSILPYTFFLVPGYGAQGGGAEDVRGAFDNLGLGAIINSSRGIMCAYKKHPTLTFDESCYVEAVNMKNDILSITGKIG
ncbi:MAG: orotidine-5'-phosphate decarboxylase [Clostridia bacterium]|nr:orotidine-5'-phosphate decarboxylase [Clostridia bacterium]MDD4387003.1 orotidine-5'-phosphate decarboxylase [Clostridia bacterium]